VVSICGDGGFTMVGTEISTAVQERLPVIFVVLNDRRLGMVELGHDAIYGRNPRYPIEVDISRLAESVGARSLVVEHPNELLDALVRPLPRDLPTVIDVRIDRTVQMPKNPRFANIGADNANRKKTLKVFN